MPGTGSTHRLIFRQAQNEVSAPRQARNCRRRQCVSEDWRLRSPARLLALPDLADHHRIWWNSAGTANKMGHTPYPRLLPMGTCTPGCQLAPLLPIGEKD
jgi:hypothetical protein